MGQEIIKGETSRRGWYRELGVEVLPAGGGPQIAFEIIAGKTPYKVVVRLSDVASAIAKQFKSQTDPAIQMKCSELFAGISKSTKSLTK